MAKPLTTLGITTFIGQFLVVCCCVGTANASVNDTTETSFETSALAAEPKPHCHDANDDFMQETKQNHHDPDKSINKHPCQGSQGSSESSKYCCNPDVAEHAVVSTQYFELSNKHKINPGELDYLLTSLVVDVVPLTRSNIPPDPKYQTPYKLTPTYLINCAFLE